MRAAGVASVGFGVGIGGIGSAEAQEEGASGATVYVGSFDGNVYALDAETGEEQWRFETGEGVRSSPTVVDGTSLHREL